MLDGHFGNHSAFHMVRQSQSHLIYMSRYDAICYLPMPVRIPSEAQRSNWAGMWVCKLPDQHLKGMKIKYGFETRTYQMQLRQWISQTC